MALPATRLAMSILAPAPMEQPANLAPTMCLVLAPPEGLGHPVTITDPATVPTHTAIPTVAIPTMAISTMAIHMVVENSLCQTILIKAI